MSVGTTECSLQDHKLERCITEKKPALNKKHLKVKLNQSKLHEQWNADAQNKIIFNNEIRMKLYSNMQNFVISPTGKWNDPCDMTEKHKKSLMFCGYIK